MALTFYQSCFGGKLEFETFDKPLAGFVEKPVISGSLVTDSLVIHSSDLVHNEGRRIGNYLSVFLPCKSADDRRVIADKLQAAHGRRGARNGEKLIEVVDRFEVRWVLGITNYELRMT